MNHLLNICNINGAEVEPVDVIIGGTVTTAAASAETAETTTAELRPDLPDTKFDGADFGIFYSNNAEYGGTKNDFFAEERSWLSLRQSL